MDLKTINKFFEDSGYILRMDSLIESVDIGNNRSIHLCSSSHKFKFESTRYSDYGRFVFHRENNVINVNSFIKLPDRFFWNFKAPYRIEVDSKEKFYLSVDYDMAFNIDPLDLVEYKDNYTYAAFYKFKKITSYFHTSQDLPNAGLITEGELDDGEYTVTVHCYEIVMEDNGYIVGLMLTS